MGSELNKSLSQLDAMADALLKGLNEETLSAEDISNHQTKHESKEDDDSKTGNAEGRNELKYTSEKSEKKVSKGLAENEILNQKFEAINASMSLLKAVVENSVATQDDTMAVFVKSFAAIAQTQSMVADTMKSIGGQIMELNSRMGNLESQPQTRKSIHNIQMFEKDFQKSAGLTKTSLSKSQIASILSDELFKGNPNVTKQDIIRFESGVPLRSDLLDLVHNKAEKTN